MKTIFKTTKRKKIKTRKSLNEIRKRSRRLKYFEVQSTKIGNEMGNSRKSNHFVTSNRLTIAMFPNAVQSETVSRISNDEANKLNLNSQDLIQDQNILEKKGLEENRKHSDSENSITDDEQKFDMTIDCPELQEIISKENHTAQQPSHQEHDDSPQVHCTHDKIYYMYEKMMSEISAYITKTASKSLYTDDITDTLKEKLFNLKVQYDGNVTTHHKPTMSNIHISNEPPDLVVEDPMDYIRLRYSAVQDTPALQSVFSTGTSNSMDSLVQSNLPQTVASSSSRTELSDTPEYIYFPHKLN